VILTGVLILSTAMWHSTGWPSQFTVVFLYMHASKSGFWDQVCHLVYLKPAAHPSREVKERSNFLFIYLFLTLGKVTYLVGSDLPRVGSVRECVLVETLVGWASGRNLV
jgi:hypothetical protein